MSFSVIKLCLCSRNQIPYSLLFSAIVTPFLISVYISKIIIRDQRTEWNAARGHIQVK